MNSLSVSLCLSLSPPTVQRLNYTEYKKRHITCQIAVIGLKIKINDIRKKMTNLVRVKG